MLSTDEVKHIATLARVGLTDAEVKHFQKDLSAVLDWFEELKTADTSGVPPETSLVPETNRSVADQIVISGEAERILANAPDTKDGYFKVKSVF